MTLTDAKYKKAKPQTKAYKLFDGGGLYLEIYPNGSKHWRLKYRFNNKEKRLSLGSYPLTSLAKARALRNDAKTLIDSGVDPSVDRREKKVLSIIVSENTFRKIADEWHSKRKGRWSEKYAANIKRRLDKDIFPHIGDDEISKLKVPQVLEVLRKVEKRGALDLATRVRETIGQVFRYAIQTGRCEQNPVIHLHGALETRTTKHLAAIEIEEIPDLMMAIEKNDARLYVRTRRAILLSMLTFVRPGELRQARTEEFDFVKKEWRIPAERMKAREEHIVPLSSQAIEIIKEQLEEISTLNTPYLFPSQTSLHQPMSDNTVRLGLHKLGFKDRMTAHGFRALARTAIREELNYEPDVIEAQLAHKPSGPLGAAYDRAKFLSQRHKMMQEWADYIDRVTQAAKTKILEEQLRKKSKVS